MSNQGDTEMSGKEQSLEAAESPVEELTEDEALEMREILSAYYGENVAPASHFCSALMEWVRVMGESGQSHVTEAWANVQLTLDKSNLAYRLVYLGEPVRTEPCPKHKGQWSGCNFFGEDPCECQSGANITGWLPPPEGAAPDRNPPIRGVVLTQAAPQPPKNSPSASRKGE